MNCIISKQCSMCGKWVPIDLYNRAGYTYHGDVRYASECKECIKKRSKDRRDKRLEYVRKFKTPCVKCGEERWYLLDFHHRNPSIKSFDILHDCLRHNIEDIDKEISKCDILCKNCHSEFHILNKNCGITYDEYINDNFNSDDAIELLGYGYMEEDE